MPDETDMDLDGPFMEEHLKAFQVSCLEYEELGTEEEEEDDSSNSDDADYEVTVGHVKKPENGWSLLRHKFPSKAGGAPVCLKFFCLSTSLSFMEI